MFASQLPGNAASFVSPVQPYTYVYYNAVDRNGNGIADLNEIDFAAGVQGSNNVDLTHPGSASTANRIGDISAPRTNEFMVGMDREVVANFGVAATFTYRRMTNFLWNPRNGVTPASYTQSTTFTGTFPNVGTVSVPIYAASGALPGYHAENRPDYYQRYLGLELSATKRLADKWMARFGFATTSYNEYFPTRESYLDPTRTPFASTSFQNQQRTGPLVDGGPVATRSTGSGKSGIYLVSPKYQFSANGLYQAPWGINVGANFVYRQGYAQPFYRDRVASGDPVLGNKEALLVGQVDDFRLDNVGSLDARVEKMFKFSTTNLALDLDVFNLFNSATILQRQLNARVTTYNSVLEVMNPRIARLGVRFTF
jgi:hypothetical protein